MKRKNNYEQPETLVTRVELESPICSGSSNFVGEGQPGVNIANQEVTTPGSADDKRNLNDFSSTPWGDEIGTN